MTEKKNSVVIGGHEVSLDWLLNHHAGFKSYDHIKALVDALRGQEPPAKEKSPGIWYSDGSAVYILEEGGGLKKLPGGGYVAELNNKFYFNIQPFGDNATEEDAKKLAEKIAKLLNVVGEMAEF